MRPIGTPTASEIPTETMPASSEGAVDHAREHVAADLVGAKEMQPARRLAHARPARRQWIVGRDQRREEGDENKEQHRRPAERSAAAPQQTPARATPGLLLPQQSRRCFEIDGAHARSLGLTRK
jgi:hypothetical protein